MGRVTSRRSIVSIEGETVRRRWDTVAAEEPLEIRLGGTPLSVTMRTPGDDFDLVHGFLATEGVVADVDAVRTMRYCAGKDEEGKQTYNVIDVTLADGVATPELSLQRNFYTTSSCGVCGKASIDAIRTLSAYDVAADPTTVSSTVLSGLPAALRAQQPVFDSTGGLHAAGLFTPTGRLLCLREDVGRHNAVDKAIGWALREDKLPLTSCVLMVSGRASFELTQKAVMAGIPILAAVSAPSSLAIDLAAESGLTLVGFLRGRRMNVYAGAQRVTTA
ncbi:MAG: formate dehydrogenase accessory sulfurtransferase FdhD [Geodermatophilaceae bacterium]|nr:formate dehydrogenase accessory sulfurtransferase FdhD [Geodermatophilaceae bacterium]